MQLLEGQSLRELLGSESESSKPGSQLPSLSRRPLPLNQALDLGMQIAYGLEAAHQKGIVHRDIKPANIFVTSQGQAKILDFGLAKLAGGAKDETEGLGHEASSYSTKPSVEEAERPTTPDLSLSRTGVAMGTAGYMSPEQARGEKLDARTDLFSFGLVLYEMSTGQRAFEGDTGPALHNAILTQTPVPVRQLNPHLSVKLAQIIKKALEKDRAARYQTMAQLRADLEIVRREVDPKARLRLFTTIAALVFALLAIGAFYWLEKRQSGSISATPDIRFRQLTINSPENPVSSGSISPNGKYLAYVDAQGIHIKDIGSGAMVAIAQPYDLKKEVTSWEIIDAAWLVDSTRFLANAHPASESQSVWSSRTTDIWLFSRLNAPPRKLREHAIAWSASPDSALISFGTNFGKFGEREIWVMDPDRGHARKLVATDETGSVGPLGWIPGSRRVFYIRTDAKGDTFWSRDINGGPPRAFLAPSDLPQNIRGDITLLPGGRVILQLGEPGSGFTSVQDTCNFWSVRVDVNTGKPLEKPTRLTNGSGGCISNANATADGKRLAFLQSSGEHGTAYVADVDSGGTRIRNSRHFTLEEGDDFIDGWWPDSKTVLIGTNRGDHYGLFKQALNSDTPEPLTPAVAGGLLEDAKLSPDGKWVLALVWPLTGNPNDQSRPQSIVRVPVTGGTPEEVFRTVRPSPFSCTRAPSNLCVIGEQSADHKQMIVTAFDVVNGRGPELARFHLSRDIDLSVDNILCAISPDGTRLAITRSPESPIEIHSLRGKPSLTIHVKGTEKIWELGWAADGKGFFVTNRVPGAAELLHVDLRGKTVRLWKNRGAAAECFGTPSPDGRHIAIYDSQRNSNMWMMENF